MYRAYDLSCNPWRADRMGTAGAGHVNRTVPSAAWPMVGFGGAPAVPGTMRTLSIDSVLSPAGTCWNCTCSSVPSAVNVA